MKHRILKHRKLGSLLVLVAVGGSGCASIRPDLAIRTATGTTAHDLCSETFVSGLDPAQTFAESLKPRLGSGFVAPLVHYTIDRKRGEVRATFAGGFTSRAVYRGADGCVLVKNFDTDAPPAVVRPVPAAPPVVPLPVAQTPPGVEDAVNEAFDENVPGAARNTKAVLVLYRDRVIAERYAPSYGPDTPILGFSLAKSIVNALVGLMVGDGKLRLDTALSLAHPLPPVTVEQALRMITGLDLDETGSGFDPSNHMFYVYTDDMAAFARKAKRLAPPGQRWAYSSAGIHLVVRQMRDALGGGRYAVQRYAQARLFTPLGMRHVTMEADETGTPIGAHYIFASARDWARFGLLYLHDGVDLNGKRLLPEHWVAWSTEPTLNTDYGAGWWVNHRRHGTPGPGDDMPLMSDVPSDAFYALGNLGQYVVVVPSRDLVVVRLGRAHTPDFEVAGTNRLVGQIIAAIDR